jgi:uncharacterized protein (TIGR00251 family)
MRMNETKEGTVLEVLVKVKCKMFKLTVEGEEVIARCTQEPIKGRVNKELVNELSRVFQKKVSLVSGITSRQKLVLIKGSSKSEVEKILAAETNRI